MTGTFLGVAALDVGAGWFAARSWFGEPAIERGPEVHFEWRRLAVLRDVPHIDVSAHTDEQTLSRPIFEKTRRPAHHERTQAAKDAVDKTHEGDNLPANFAVKAIVRFRGGTRTFVTFGSPPDGAWRSAGDSIDGWTVVKIDDQALTLKHGDHSARVELSYDENGFGAPSAPSASRSSAPPQDSNLVRELKGRRG